MIEHGALPTLPPPNRGPRPSRIREKSTPLRGIICQAAGHSFTGTVLLWRRDDHLDAPHTLVMQRGMVTAVSRVRPAEFRVCVTTMIDADPYVAYEVKRGLVDLRKKTLVLGYLNPFVEGWMSVSGQYPALSAHSAKHELDKEPLDDVATILHTYHTDETVPVVGQSGSGRSASLQRRRDTSPPKRLHWLMRILPRCCRQVVTRRNPG